MVEGAHSPEAGLQAHAQDLLDKFKTAVDAGKTQEAAQFAQELQGDEYTQFLDLEDFHLINDALESAGAAQESKAQGVEEVVAAGEADDENDVSTTLEQQEVTQNGDDGENEFAASLKDIPELLELDISFDDAETKTTIGAAHQQATQIVDAIQHGQIQTKGTASARWNKQIGPPLQLLAAKYTSLIAAGDTEQANRVRAQRSRFLQVKQRIDAYFDAMKAAEAQEPAAEAQAPAEQAPEQAERSQEAQEIIGEMLTCQTVEELQTYIRGARRTIRTFSADEQDDIARIQSARQEELRTAAEAQAPAEQAPEPPAEEPVDTKNAEEPNQEPAKEEETHPLGELATYDEVKALYNVIAAIEEKNVNELSLDETAMFLRAIRDGRVAIETFVLGDGGDLAGVAGRARIEYAIQVQVFAPAENITQQLNERSRELLQADTDPVWQQLRAIIALDTATIPNDRFDGVITALEGAIGRLVLKRAQLLDSVNKDELHPKIVAFDEQLQQVKAKLEDVKERKASGIEQANPGETEEEVKKKRALKRVTEAWNNIKRSEAVTKNDPNNARLLTAEFVPSQDNIESAGIYPLLEHFFTPEEAEMWRTMIDLHDAFNAAANKDIFKQMYFTNATESRNKAASHISFDQMRAFSEMEAVQPVFESMHSYFQQPQRYKVKIVDGKNFPVPDNYRAQRGERVVDVVHDYAMDGNPNSKQVADGVLSIAELLKRDHPDVHSAIIDSVQYLAVLSEVRVKYYSMYYAAYLKTADGTFDTKVISYHAPMAACSYKIRGYGKIPGDLMMLWQIMRYPDRGGAYVRKADPQVKPSERSGNRVEEYLPEDDSTKKLHFNPNNPNIHGVPQGAYNNDQIVEAIEVRQLEDEALTRFYGDFEPVQMGEDLSIFPYYWDIIFTHKSAITYEEYNLALQAWTAFVNLAQYPPEIHRTTDVDDIISQLVGKISPFKSVLGILPENTPAGTRLRGILQQVLLRSTKHLYDQYDAKAAWTNKDYVMTGKTKRGYFFKQAIDAFESLGTMDGGLQKFMIDKIRSYSEVGAFDDLFSESHGEPLSLWAVKGNLSEMRRRQALVNQYKQAETPKEKAE